MCRYNRAGSAIVALLIAGTVIPGSSHAQERNVYFGQTHQHTSWSLDAYILGNSVTGPAEAYQYSMGQTIKHPAGYDLKIKTPLDFQGVTDHSEYVGVVRLANDPSSPISKLPVAERLKVTAENTTMDIFQWMAGSIANNQPIKELLDPSIMSSVWQQNAEIADKYYKPGEFTTFCAYEWTSMPQNQNMHRNVFFRDCAKLPEMPFSAIDSDHPEDLWNWLEDQRAKGNEGLAISHNANLSNGLMFPTELDSKGNPIDAAWVAQRMTNEPLTEIKQVKGASETNPGLSPNDEFANFEIMNYLIGLDSGFSKLNGSYIREAYQNGLAMQSVEGYNPYKFGVVGAGDSHNTATSYSQSNFFGDHGFADATPDDRLSGRVDSGMALIQTGTSGLAGVWAEENTRESIFDAMKRREVYGTSGVRIQLRMFGGWNYTASIFDQDDWATQAYAGGVPMGGDLPQTRGETPTFLVWAVKDPADGNLDRIQIVKGWTENGQIFEKIYDVVWSDNRQPDPDTGKLPPVGNTVDIQTASYTNDIGAVELKTLWVDPDFDPSLPAFYYARVLQIPTPRWSTYDAVALGVLPPATVSPTVQERAWGTPIWYAPGVEDRSAADPGTTVADILKQGAIIVGENDLKTLVVGKDLNVTNTVTGETASVLFGADGKRVVSRLDEGPIDGGMILSSVHGSTAPYTIRDGKIVTTINGSDFGLTLFKMGDDYLAARSNEFGFVNYKVTSPRAAGAEAGTPEE